MKNFIAQGNKITMTAGGTVSAGDPVVLEDRAGIAENDATSGQDLVVLLEGIVELAKSTEAFAVGEKLYWDAGGSAMTSTASSHKPLGWAAEAAATGVTASKVKLGGF